MPDYDVVSRRNMMRAAEFMARMVHKVSVRFTEKEYQRLKAYTEAINKTMTEALKDGIELLYENEPRK